MDKGVGVAPRFVLEAEEGECHRFWPLNGTCGPIGGR